MDEVIKEKDHMITLLHAEINEWQNKNAQGEGAIAHHKDKVKTLNQDGPTNGEMSEDEKDTLI
jgi:hypothetical protein